MITRDKYKRTGLAQKIAAQILNCLSAFGSDIFLLFLLLLFWVGCFLFLAIIHINVYHFQRLGFVDMSLKRNALKMFLRILHRVYSGTKHFFCGFWPFKKAWVLH